jgi:hypothetical protein
MIKAGDKNRSVAVVEQMVRDTPAQQSAQPATGTVGAALTPGATKAL